MMFSTALPRLMSFWKQPLLFKLTFAGAWILLGLSRLAIMFVEFKRIASVLGKQDGTEPRVPIASPKNELRSRIIGLAIRAAARWTPWESNCFPQAITATILLRFFQIPYAVFLGISNEKQMGELDAHAWVVSGRTNVTGGASFRKYTSVGCFVSKDSHSDRRLK